MDSPHPKRYKALLIRAQSLGLIEEKLIEIEANGSKDIEMKPKPHYKALLIKSRSPKPSEDNSTESEANDSQTLK